MFGNNASPLPKPLDQAAGVSRKRQWLAMIRLSGGELLHLGLTSGPA
jgi:hypothetical protein